MCGAIRISPFHALYHNVNGIGAIMAIIGDVNAL